MTHDQVLQMHLQLGGKRFSGLLLDRLDLFAEHLNADDDVPDQLPAIGVGDLSAAGKFFDLAEVVHERAEHQQLTIDLRITRGQQVRQLHHVDRVTQQAAGISVMVVDRGRRGPQTRHQVTVGKVRLAQSTKVDVAETFKEFFDARLQTIGFFGIKSFEVGRIDFRRIHPLQVLHDHLQSPVVNLRAPATENVITPVERIEFAFVGVPQHPRDHTGPVRQSQQNVLAALSVDT